MYGSFFMSDISIHQEEIDRYPVKQYFNYEGRDRDDDFDFFVGWSQDTGIKTPEDMHLELKKIEQRLGDVYVGEDRITRIKNYLIKKAKLDSAWKDIISMERNA